MSGAPAAPVTTISATAPCRTTDGVTVTLNTAAAGGGQTPTQPATMPRRSDPRTPCRDVTRRREAPKNPRPRGQRAKRTGWGALPGGIGEGLRGLGALLAKELLDLRHEIRRRRPAHHLPAGWLDRFLRPGWLGLPGGPGGGGGSSVFTYSAIFAFCPFTHFRPGFSARTAAWPHEVQRGRPRHPRSREETRAYEAGPPSDSRCRRRSGGTFWHRTWRPSSAYAPRVTRPHGHSLSAAQTPLCREREGSTHPRASGQCPPYVSGIENPKAALALVRRVLSLLGAEADLSDLVEATRQFEHNLDEVVGQKREDRRVREDALERKPTEDEERSSQPRAG